MNLDEKELNSAEAMLITISQEGIIDLKYLTIFYNYDTVFSWLKDRGLIVDGHYKLGVAEKRFAALTRKGRDAMEKEKKGEIIEHLKNIMRHK